jgi:hypothetical protein
MIKNRLIVYFIIVLLIGVIILFLLKPKKDELDLEKNMNSSLKSIGPLCSVDNCVGKAGIVKGVEGNGFKFNNSVYIELDYDSLDVLGSNNFTIDFWFKKDKDTIGDLLSKGDSKKKWFTFTQRNSFWKNEVWIQFDDGTIPREIRSYKPIDYYDWHRTTINFIREGNNWIIGLYLDEKLFNNTVIRIPDYGLLNNTEPLFLGNPCGGNLSKGNEYGCFEYWGAIDEFRIFDEKRMALVDLTFDNIEGDKVIDSSGNGNNGTIHGLDIN